MDNILQARCTQLERQLELYTAVTSHQQQALFEMFQALEQHQGRPIPAAKVDELKGKVSFALSSAPTRLRGGDSRARSSPQRDLDQINRDADSLDSYCREMRSTFHVSQDSLSDVSHDIAQRIHETVVRLLHIWLDHMSKKVERTLEEPNQKFAAFHDHPAEETLTEFMDSFQESSRRITLLLHAATEESRRVEVESGERPSTGGIATGNPFVGSEEGRLIRMFSNTIEDALKSVVTTNDGPHQGAVKAQLGATFDDHRNAVSDSAPFGNPPASLARTRGPQDDSDKRQFRSETSAQQQAEMPYRYNSDQGSTPARQQSKPKPPLPNIVGIPSATTKQSKDEATSAPRVTTPSLSAAVTPRRRGQANDSSQIWSTMVAESRPVPTPRATSNLNGCEGGVDGLLQGARSGSGTSTPTLTAPSTGADRLTQLNAVLRQLEFQLSGVAMNSRSTGSEAKYYALSKKLQKVRAEVLKEQREADEVRKAEAERDRMRQFKEDNRRTFHR